MNQQQYRAPRPSVEAIAKTLVGRNEFVWLAQQRRIWGFVAALMALAVVASSVAVVYIGGRQAAVFSGYAVPTTPALNAYFVKYSATGIKLAQSAPATPHDWAFQLAAGLNRCWENPSCQKDLQGRVWVAWQKDAGFWFPELAWAVRGLQIAAGGFLLALFVYGIALLEVKNWQEWELRQDRVAGQPGQEQALRQR